MGIAHLEDLPVKELVNVIANLYYCKFTTKIDGSHVVFGVDRFGFYVSDCGTRIYKLEDFSKDTSKNYLIVTFWCLRTVLVRMQSLYYKLPYFEVEAECVCGYTNNVIPYVFPNHIQYTIISTTHPTEHVATICCLMQDIVLTGTRNLTIPVNALSAPLAELDLVDNKFSFYITSAPAHTVDLARSDAGDFSIAKFVSFANTKSIYGKTVAELCNLPLNRCPEFIDKSKWKEDKFVIAQLRTKLRELALDVKHNILEANIWVEVPGGHTEGFVGVLDGVIFKIVDRVWFGATKEYVWKERKKITSRPATIYDDKTTMSKLYLALGEILGDKVYGTTGNVEDITALCATITQSVPHSIKQKILDVLAITQVQLVNDAFAYRDYVTNDNNSMHFRFGHRFVRYLPYTTLWRTAQVYSTYYDILDNLHGIVKNESNLENIIMHVLKFIRRIR